MNKKNTPEISVTLQKNQLEYIPEAHCYLKFEDQIRFFALVALRRLVISSSLLPRINSLAADAIARLTLRTIPASAVLILIPPPLESETKQ